MHWMIAVVQFLAAPMIPVMELLVPALSGAAGRGPVHSDTTVAAFALSTGVIGFVSICWACWMHVRLRDSRHRMKLELANAQLGREFREALLDGAAQGTALLRGEGEERQFFGRGRELFENFIGSVEARQAIRAVDALTEDGAPFAMRVHGDGGAIIARGLPVAGRAVVYLYQDMLEEKREPHKDILESLPVPVWMRDADKGLVWANQAFLAAVGARSLEDAVRADAALEDPERELTRSVVAARAPAESRASVIVGGESRSLALNLAPVSDTAMAGIATDITDHLRTEARLQHALDAEEDMIERLPYALAVFDAERKLAAYNGAYATLWGLSRAWLDGHPGYGEILDQLRERRRLPEQRNFAEWKQALLRGLSHDGSASDDTWHLPGGKSIRIAQQPHLKGGVFAIYEDITEPLHLESSLNLLTQVQKATLDTLDEGIAIFGTDGRLVLHNALFQKMWQLDENELAGQPHFAEIANLCTDRIGRDGIWGIVSCGINSATPERFSEWGKARRADGRMISLSLSRLPNGATVAAFTDITDLENFSHAQQQSDHKVA